MVFVCVIHIDDRRDHDPSMGLVLPALEYRLQLDGKKQNADADL